MTNLPIKVMYPKGRVVHYAVDMPGFQKIKTLCGKVMDWDYWINYEDWAGTTPSCKTCLKKRHEYA
jgi:hypothetical protein